MTQHARLHQDSHINGDDQIPLATTTVKGIMASADKLKLQEVESKAERNYAVVGGTISYNALEADAIEGDLLSSPNAWNEPLVVLSRTGSPSTLQNDAVGRIIDTTGGSTGVYLNFNPSSISNATYYFTSSVILDSAYLQNNVATQFQFNYVGVIVVGGVAEHIYSFVGASQSSLVQMAFVKAGAFYIRIWSGFPTKTLTIPSINSYINTQVGDGITNPIIINHNLGVHPANVVIMDNATKNTVLAEVTLTDANSLSINFVPVASADEYTVRVF